MHYRKNLLGNAKHSKKLPGTNFLTLGDLMRMDGEDLWVEYFDRDDTFKKEWTICRFLKAPDGTNYLCLGFGRFLSIFEYNVTWRAYLESPNKLPIIEKEIDPNIIPIGCLLSMEQKGVWLEYLDDEGALNGRWVRGHFVQGKKDSYYRTDFGKLLFLSDYSITWQASYKQPDTPEGAIPMEELRYMNGARVWVEHKFYDSSIEGWATVVIDLDYEDYCLLDSGEKLFLSRQCLETNAFESHASYEKTWWAYYQRPKPDVSADNQPSIPSIRIPNLDPIPVNDLREMDGKSVWVVWREETVLKIATSQAVVVISPIGNNCQTLSGKSLSFGDYDTDWLAYSKKAFEEWLAGECSSAGKE